MNKDYKGFHYEQWARSIRIYPWGIPDLGVMGWVLASVEEAGIPHEVAIETIMQQVEQGVIKPRSEEDFNRELISKLKGILETQARYQKLPDTVVELEAASELIDAKWLADRSSIAPDGVNPNDYLRALYKPGEVLWITGDNDHDGFIWQYDKGNSQDVWPPETWPVSFSIHPIDKPEVRGKRIKKESITEWRYVVLESERQHYWLAWLVNAKIPIVSICDCGAFCA